MKSLAFRSFVLVGFLSMIPAWSMSQVGFDQRGRWEHDPGYSWFLDYNGYSQAEALIAQSQWKLIEAESSDPQNEWAGHFLILDETRLRAFRWAPQSGFVAVSVYTCEPLLTRLSYGRVIASPEMFQVFPDFSSHAPAGQPVSMTWLPALKYLPVKWGERHYLIAEDEVKDFCDFVAGLGDYQDDGYFAAGYIEDHFLLKSDDYEKPKEGLPILPLGYSRFVKKPIDAMITAVGRGQAKQSDDPGFEDIITPVTLSIGSAQGVKPGMKFHILSIEEPEMVKVVRVTQNRAQGIIVRSVRKNSEAESKAESNEQGNDNEIEFPPITVGWKLSTSPHKK